MENFDLLGKRLAIDSRIQKLMNKGVKIPAYLDDFNSTTDNWYPVLKMIITKDELTDEIISFCKQLD
jgi:hypothetical protein